MYKNIISFISISLFMSGIAFGMTPENPVQPDRLAAEKAKVERELKKNQGELKKFKSNEKISPAIAKIEPALSKIFASDAFKSIIDAMTNKQAQDMQQGKSFEEVKYNHSLTTEFPKFTNPNKLLAKIYSLMANSEQYQLLLSKLSSSQAASGTPLAEPASTAPSAQTASMAPIAPAKTEEKQ